MSSAEDFYEEWVDAVTAELVMHTPDPTVPEEGGDDE